jgi:preprotein translocase subunit SecD
VPDSGDAAAPTGCPADADAAADPAAALASARAKLGRAYDVADAIRAPAAADAAALAAFSTLTCAEVAALPAQMQYVVPTVTCAMLDGRPPTAVGAQPSQAIAACDSRAKEKYLLDAVAVDAADIAGASAENRPAEVGWQLRIRFSRDGQARFTALTRAAVTDNAQIAFVLDNAVLVAPSIMDVIHGDAVISGGGIDGKQVRDLAAAVRGGALPVALTVTSTRRVT